MIEITPEIRGIKYEYDKQVNALVVDRYMTASMHYPLPYGFAPETLALDGDPLDVLVISPYPLLPGVYINVEPIAALKMSDEAGQDEKILAVPACQYLRAGVKVPSSLAEVDPSLMASISHFFTHYKDHEDGKWVKIDGWCDRQEAQELVRCAIENY